MIVDEQLGLGGCRSLHALGDVVQQARRAFVPELNATKPSLDPRADLVAIGQNAIKRIGWWVIGQKQRWRFRSTILLGVLRLPGQ